jgi:hypothetical protein
MQAEALKDSNDWKITTDELIRIQNRWKEIGPVPRKQSDILWKRFRAACNEFFERKNKYFSNIDSQQDENLKKKLDLITRVSSFVHQDSAEENLMALRAMQNEWSDIGHVPFRMKDKIQKEFREALNEQFDKLNIDESKRNVIMFKQHINSMNQQGRSDRQMQMEREKILERIRQLESDIAVLDNNIGFFAKTKNAESLILDVNKKIENARNRIKVEKQKLDLLQKIE